jgi:hypothetical protein
MKMLQAIIKKKKETSCPDAKIKTGEKHWSIFTYTERKQEDKHCEGQVVWRWQGAGKRVMEKM